MSKLIGAKLGDTAYLSVSDDGKLQYSLTGADGDFVEFETSSGGGDIDTSNLTATADDLLATKTAIGLDGTEITGTIQTVTLQQNGNTVSVAKGYVAEDASITVEGTGTGGTDISDATATADMVLAGAIFYGLNGRDTGTIQTVTATLTDNVVTVPKGYIAEARTLTVATATASKSGNVVTIPKGFHRAQTLTVGTAKQAETIVPGAKDIVIPADTYLKGDLTIQAVEDFDFSAATGSASNPGNLADGMATSVKAYDGTGTLVTGSLPDHRSGYIASPIITDVQETYSLFTTGIYGPSNVIAIEGIGKIVPENLKKDVTFLGVTGTYEGESFDFSEATLMDSADLMNGVVAYGYNGEKYTGTLPFYVKDFMIKNLEQVVIPDGLYRNSLIYVSDNNIQAANIKQGITILGVTGTYEGEGSSVDLSVVTAEAQYVLSGQKFVNSAGETVTGTAYDFLDNPSVYLDTSNTSIDEGTVRLQLSLLEFSTNTAMINGNTVFYTTIMGINGYNVTPTKEAQPICSYTYVYGTLTVDPIPDEYITTTDATATATDILKDKTAYVNGEKVTGTLEDMGVLTVELTENAQTFPGGYYGLIEVPAAPASPDLTNLTAENIRYGVTINGIDGTFSQEITDGPSEIFGARDGCILSGYAAYVNGERVIGSMYQYLPTEGYGGVNLFGLAGVNIESTDSGVKFSAPMRGYINNSVVALIDGILAENIKQGITILGVTGTYEGTGGGNGDSSGIKFYECKTYTPATEGYTQYSLTLSGASDTAANTTYERTKWVGAPDPDPDSDRTTTAQWTASNGYTIIEEYGDGFYYYYIKNASGTSVYSADTMIEERADDYNNLPWCDSEYDRAALTFTVIPTGDVPATPGGWTGVLMVQDANTGEWSASATDPVNLTVRGHTPQVGKVYNQDTTVLANLYSNFFIQPFNVSATSYTGSAGSDVLYSYASGAAAYCSRLRSDWTVPPEGIALLPPLDSSKQQLGGNNYDTGWYYAWSGGAETVLKGFQCSLGYGGSYGNAEFVLEGSASNSQTDSDWTAIATFTATTDDYDKVIYYSVASNNTAYMWYRIKVTQCRTHPSLGYLASFTKDIGEVYYEE